MYTGSAFLRSIFLLLSILYFLPSISIYLYLYFRAHSYRAGDDFGAGKRFTFGCSIILFYTCPKPPRRIEAGRDPLPFPPIVPV